MSCLYQPQSLVETRGESASQLTAQAANLCCLQSTCHNHLPCSWEFDSDMFVHRAHIVPSGMDTCRYSLTWYQTVLCPLFLAGGQTASFGTEATSSVPECCSANNSASLTDVSTAHSYHLFSTTYALPQLRTFCCTLQHCQYTAQIVQHIPAMGFCCEVSYVNPSLTFSVMHLPD